MEKQKKKILVIADSPLVPSGVGTQTKYMIESMLRTGEFSFVCLAGALQHQDYRPQKVEPYGEDWIIYPVDGYGSQNLIREFLRVHKPDLLWFMTDPRFYTWLWDMEDEVRKNVPMVYYHVWDNYPYPTFNKKYYDANDLVVAISKVTEDIVKTVSPDVDCVRITHAVDTDIFKKRPESEWSHIVDQAKTKDKFVFFWNNRNARRKQSGTLIFWFNDFLNEVGKDKATLIMHTEPFDPHGQDLEAIMRELDLDNGEVLLSTTKMPSEQLSHMYNMADCTINIADAEGFGLGTLESLACETPIIVTMTGGLQEQVTDGEEWFGVGIEPTAKAVIGSQDVPFIYEDRIPKEACINAMMEIYSKTPKERAEIGSKGRGHVLKNHHIKDYSGSWYTTLNKVIEKNGSWDTRKNYNSWELIEV
jgi:glycosyltransferase involved in cell wall biosynthesis